MSDCTNLEVRERLPEYVHGRLAALELKWVETHIASCAECASELSLLHAVRAAYDRVPAVNTAAIVSALPRPRPARRRWDSTPALLRLAAVVSFISLGGISLATLRGFLDRDGSGMTDSAVVLSRGEDTARGRNGVDGVNGTPAISFGGGVSDLEAEDLLALLAAVDALEGAPPADPEDFLLSGGGRGGS
ncbi:MAG TPA: zf-HC2 domain-containing protein [Gemmatimonadaceae bacterium]|nr:zf-HC2 domain-containing protein [Gemmatimonadaceae bacterium]